MNWLRESPAFTEREYLSSGVIMLTNSLKITDTTLTKFLELIFFQSDQKIWQKYCRAGLSSLSDTLTCWLSISVLKRSFFGHLSIPACSLKFQKQITSKAHLFFQSISKLYVDFGNWEKSRANIFSFSVNSIWIGCVKRSLLLRENTCHRVSIC